MVWVNKESVRGPLPCNDWLDSGLITDPANRTPRVVARKRKMFVFKTSSRAVMSPKKNVIRHVGVTFTNCALNTNDTESAVRKRATKVDERYNMKVRVRAKGIVKQDRS